MKQKFKGKMLTRRQVVNNILSTYQKRTEADEFDWYREANEYAQYLARHTGATLIQCCGVIAAFSPLKTWEQNKIIAFSFLRTRSGKHTKAFKDKARAILKASTPEEICDILNGRKITAFFLNIFYPDRSDVLTIDRHAIAIALGRNAKDNEQNITAAQYAFFMECYTIAAARAEIPPIQMQAITWETWRRLKRPQGSDFDDVPF